VKRVLVGLLLLAGVGAVVFVGSRTSPAPAARRNVVLVTIDTLRADRIGRGVAPALDRLAASGVRFTAARATVPLTLPSHVSIMTGTLPVEHGIRDNGVVLPDGLPTLATVFRDAGYRTGAFVGAYVLDRRFGLSRGFETYDDRVPRDPDADARLEADRRAADVVDAALAWLDSSARPPFFLWVHLYDPHAPYDPPEAFRTRHESLYDGEVAYADAQTARVLAHLDRRGLQSSTVIVVAGDHGEGLGEHDEQTHGMLAYDTTLKVPLIVSAPELVPQEIDAPVSLADLPGSILRLAGVTAALAPTASAEHLLAPRPGVETYAETQYPLAAGWHPLAVLAGEQWKLILSSEAELYDVSADPGESSNLAATRPAVVQAMSGRLTALRSSARTEGAGAISPDAAARLRALGFVSGAASGQSADASAPNPARTIESWARFEHALSAMNGGDTPSALPALAELAARFPAGPVFQSTYARALQATGRAREAVDVLRAAVARWPADAALFHDLAVAARAAGDSREAMRAEEAALSIEKDQPAAVNGIGLLHADAGRAQDAAAAFERAANADPSNASYWSNLGNALRDLGDVAAAERAYRRALEAQPLHPDASNGLGVLLVQRRQPADAVQWFERAVEQSPDFHEARLNLGIAYQESGQREQAIAAYREVLRRAPARFTRERKAASELLRALQ
jgi:arylsulfatase A-like enzyme/tetratricopeptide (TPR) repeat protein